MVMGVNFCPNCGQRVKRVANFCPKCGVKLATMIANSKEPLEGVEPEYLLPADAEASAQDDRTSNQKDASAKNNPGEILRTEDPDNFLSDTDENFPQLKRRDANEIAQAAKPVQDHVSIPSVGLAAALAAVAGGVASTANTVPDESPAEQKDEPPVKDSESALNLSLPMEVTSKKNFSESTIPLVSDPAGAWTESSPQNNNTEQNTQEQPEKKDDALPVSSQDNVAEKTDEPDSQTSSPKGDESISSELAINDELAAARAELAKAEAELAAVQEMSNASDKTSSENSSGSPASAINSTGKNDTKKINLTSDSSRDDGKELIKLEPVPTEGNSVSVDEENSSPIGSDGEVAAPKKNPAPASTDGQGSSKSFVVAIILLALIAAIAVYLQMNS